MATFTVLNGTGINGNGIRFGSLSQIGASGIAGVPSIGAIIGIITFNDGGKLFVHGNGMSFTSPDTFEGTVFSLTYGAPGGTNVFTLTAPESVALADVATWLINGSGDEQLTLLADIFSEFDTINGSTQDDWLMGFAGGDSILADAGNDTLTGGAGADVLNGGDGFDTADYTTSLEGVTVFLDVGPHPSFGDAGGDVLFSIEQLIGSEFADVLRRASLFGRGGDDQLNGIAGNDNLCGGDGADTLNGGDGFDLARYDYATSGVAVDLAEHSGLAGEALGDIINADVEGVVGSAHADTLRGDGGDNRLEGLAGADVLVGRAGSDILLGGDGADTLDGGTSNDFLFGGDGADNFTALAADLEASTFDYVFDFADGEDSIVLSGWDPLSFTAFESNGSVFITSSAIDHTGGIAVLNTTLAQVLDQIVVA